MLSIAYFCIKYEFRLSTFLVIYLRLGIFLPSINIPRCKLGKCIFSLLHRSSTLSTILFILYTAYHKENTCGVVKENNEGYCLQIDIRKLLSFRKLRGNKMCVL